MTVDYPFRKIIYRTKDHPSIMEKGIRYYLCDFNEHGFHEPSFNEDQCYQINFFIKKVLHDASGDYAWLQFLGKEKEEE